MSARDIPPLSDRDTAESNAERIRRISSEGLTIPATTRDTTLSVGALCLIMRHGGDSADTRREYARLVSLCEGKLDPGQPEKCYKSALGKFNKDIKDKSTYKPPIKRPLSHHTRLSKEYIGNHRYIVGVQKLCKGGFGNDTVYEYRGGVWKPQSDTDVKSTLAKIVIGAGLTPDPKEVDKAYKVIVMSGERLDVEKFNPDENLICFGNGVYRLSDGATLPHSPDYLFTIQLNANIPDSIQPTPYCDLCISNFGGADKEKLLYQIAGAAISNVYVPRFKKAFLQYGKGDSGKTQIKNLVERVLGHGNYNNVDLSDLENNRFLSAAFQSVRCGGSNDMSNVRIREEKTFKQLTGGDSIQAENKGEKGFTFRYKGILWFLANQLPLFGGDKGEHVYNRWIVFPCEHSIPPEQQIKDLCDRMYAERDSFCIKALQALQEAVSNNYTFSIPESCKIANAEYRRKNSVVRTFIDECCEPLNRDKPPKGQTTGKFWQVFKAWCVEGNYYLPGKSEFRRELADIAGISEKELDYHTKDGNFYPFTLTEQYIRDEYPQGIPTL